MISWTDGVVSWIISGEEAPRNIVPVPGEEGVFINMDCPNIKFVVEKEDEASGAVYMRVANDDNTEQHTLRLYSLRGTVPYSAVQATLVKEYDKNLSKFAEYYMHETGLLSD